MEQTAAERFHAHFQNNQKLSLVEVTAPSGFTYIFQKPSKYKILFSAGGLPTSAASAAVESWEKTGDIPVTTGEEDGNVSKFITAALRIRDQVLSLSHSPKLVVGEADPTKDEVSTDDVSDDDLDFLFKWVSAGGVASEKLMTFPRERGPDSAPGTDSQTLRRAAKRPRRSKAKK